MEPTHLPDYNCVACKYSTNNKYFYFQHLASKKHQAGGIRPPRADKLGEVYNCAKCEYTSLNKNNYKTHVLNNHASSEERKAGFTYYCESCDFGVFMKSAYDIHLATKRHLMKTSNQKNI